MSKNKKPKPVVKKEKRFLRCRFTPEELLEVGKTLADATNALVGLEEDKKRVMSDFKAKLDAKNADITIASNKISTGYENRSVECDLVMNTPTEGKKTVIRTDTKEKVGVEEMSEQELNPELPLEPEPQPED
jgi:hypothetical protein